MQYVMKAMIVAVMTVLGVILTIVPAHAQSGSRALAHIPFDFLVGNTTLKAGSYTVEQLRSGLLAFSSKDGKEHQFVLTIPGDSDNQSQEPHLVFTRYGSEAFLKKVFFAGNEDYDELLQSSREKELTKNQHLATHFLCSSSQHIDVGDADVAVGLSIPRINDRVS